MGGMYACFLNNDGPVTCLEPSCQFCLNNMNTLMMKTGGLALTVVEL